MSQIEKVKTVSNMDDDKDSGNNNNLNLINDLPMSYNAATFGDNFARFNQSLASQT